MDKYIFDDIRKEMRRSFSGSPKYVFHGTRCPTNIIKDRGLVFDSDFLMSKIRLCLKKNDMDIGYWLYCEPTKNLSDSYNPGKIMGKLSDDPQYRDRRKITVSTDVKNAITGAKICPELLYDAVISILKYNNFRHRRRDNDKELNNYAIRCLERIGEEKVVVIDAKDPDINVVDWHAFTTTQSGMVPPRAIVGIVDKSSFNMLTND